jgi:cytochrome P450
MAASPNPPASPEELDILRELRARSSAEGGVFWAGEDQLAVFDPETAQQVNALNFSDLTLPDRFVDLLRRRASKAVSWKQIRAAWGTPLRRLAEAEEVGRLATRMATLLDERLDRPLDLVWAAQEVCSQALLPIVVAGLPPADLARIRRDQTAKLAQLLATEVSPRSIRKEVQAILIQVSAGLAVRRELRGRAKGRRPRQLDLADPVVDLLPDLGMDRAVDAVTAVLTAIAGPPGAVAACLLYELTRRPDWAARLAGELAPIPLGQLCEAPTRAAPMTHRFVKETLRMWSPPLLMNRPVRTAIDLDKAHLDVGQRYLLSTYLIHHDPRHWQDPDTFDPDRWVPEAAHGPCTAASYVPFGWSPRVCIGAGLATTQLILLCQLVCTRYHIELEAPEAVRMALAAVPVPRGFRGKITLH